MASVMSAVVGFVSRSLSKCQSWYVSFALKNFVLETSLLNLFGNGATCRFLFSFFDFFGCLIDIASTYKPSIIVFAVFQSDIPYVYLGFVSWMSAICQPNFLKLFKLS